MGSNWVATLVGLKPAAWWRLDEKSGTTAFEKMGSRNGTYVGSPSLNRPGAVNDGDNSTTFVAKSHQYVTVPDNDTFSLVIANDDFGRPSSPIGGWGTADHGGNWTAQISGDLHHYSIQQNIPIDKNYALIGMPSSGGTFQMGLPAGMADGEIQVTCKWDSHPSAGYTDVAGIVARMQDIKNLYRAILKERSDHSLELSIVRTVESVTTTLMAVNVGTYVLGDWWVIRTQWHGHFLRARAWNRSAVQPAVWQVDTLDTAFSTGTVGLRVSNSGSGTETIVSFKEFWVQRLGLTVHVWMRIDIPIFDDSDGCEIGNGGTYYCHWLGKGDASKTGQLEWLLRLYSNVTDPADDRHGRVSAYLFSLYGGRGSGDDWQPGLSADSRDNLDPAGARIWHQYVALFPAGDYLDPRARVQLFRDGYWQHGNVTIFPAGPGPGSLYSNTAHPILPGNGSAPLRFATRDTNSFLSGGLDEVAIFHRVLTPTEIELLFKAGR